MPHLSTADDIKNRSTQLIRQWRLRNDSFKDWYKILTMEDDSAIKSPREQYVGNDPRTFYNLSRYLFATADVKHLLDTTILSEREIQTADVIEDLVRRGWRDNNRRNLRKGKGGWINEFEGLMLATGWYAVFVMPFEDRLVAEIWNPAQVYPDFEDSDLGIVDVVRVYQISRQQAMKLAHNRGWAVPNIWGADETKVTLYNYFSYTNEGVPYNAVVIHNELVRWEELPELDIIPVRTGPTGGLPDRGVILDTPDYTRLMGEAIFATNTKIYKQINRSMTHEQQILKDTAQPPLLEKKNQQGGKPIVDENKIFTRAYVMRMTTQDTVEVLAMPGLPPELRQHIFDMNAQRQRGSMPDLTFGNVQTSGITALMINQVTGAAQNILQPYLETTVSVLEDIDETWAKGVLEKKWKPYKWSRPNFAPKPDDVEFNVDFRVKLPGDLAARAQIARTVDPEFNLDTETTIRLLFPEIPNPMTAVAKSRADMALRSPLAQIVIQVAAYETESQLLKKSNPRVSELYAKAAQKLEVMLEQQGIEQPGGSPNGATPQLPAQGPLQ